MEIKFPYFLKKSTSQISKTVEYKCRMHGSLNNEDDLVLEIQVPILPPSPIPASGVLPKSLGHWGIAKVNLRFLHFIWIEDLIRLIESVTSHNLIWQGTNPPAEDHELSLESMTRALGRKLRDNRHISWFNVTIKNYAQSGNTFASIEWPSVSSH